MEHDPRGGEGRPSPAGRPSPTSATPYPATGPRPTAGAQASAAGPAYAEPPRRYARDWSAPVPGTRSAGILTVLAGLVLAAFPRGFMLASLIPALPLALGILALVLHDTHPFGARRIARVGWAVPVVIVLVGIGFYAWLVYAGDTTGATG